LQKASFLAYSLRNDAKPQGECGTSWLAQALRLHDLPLLGDLLSLDLLQDFVLYLEEKILDDDLE